MKFTMSPVRAYLLGLWKSRRTKEGVGVEGRAELCEAFLQLCLQEKLCQPDKVQYREERREADGKAGIGPPHKCFFYNTALRTWLDEELKKREERLKYRNGFAASYFAGVFDARGGWADSTSGVRMPFLSGDRTDEIVLLRLGFRVKKERGKLAILSDDFYNWIVPYLRLEIGKKK